MECSDINARLQAYLDGTLVREEQAAVEEHLAGCQRCSTSLEEIRRTVELLRDLDEVEPPPWMTQKVMAMVRAEGPPRRSLLYRFFKPFSVKLPIEALAVVLLGVATYYVFKGIEVDISGVKRPAVVTKKDAPSEVEAPPSRDTLPAVTPRGAQEPARALEGDRAVPRDRQAHPAPVQVPAAGGARDVRLKDQEEVKASEGVRRQESPAPPVPAAPGAARSEAGKVDLAPAAAPPEQESRLKAAKLEKPEKARRAVAAVSVYVQDTSRAQAQIAEAVEGSKGIVVGKETVPGGVLIHVRVDPGKFDELLGRIKSIGRTEEGATAPAVREGTSEFSIAVLGEPAR